MRVHVAAAFAAAVLLVCPSSSLAQGHARPAQESSADLIRSRAARVRAAASPGALAGTGDPDSFGRNVTHLGVAQTMTVFLAPDCSFSSPEFERCLTTTGSPETVSFDEADLARIDLPAKSTHSLVCFALTPFLGFEFFNLTGVQQLDANIDARAEVTVESPVLADPALVNLQTGQPFGGSLRVTLPTYFESRSLAADERAFKELILSRTCIGGLLSKAGLMGIYGLTEAQATELLHGPITLRFGARGQASLVSFASYFYGIRLYGD